MPEDDNNTLNLGLVRKSSLPSSCIPQPLLGVTLGFALVGEAGALDTDRCPHTTELLSGPADYQTEPV